MPMQIELNAEVIEDGCVALSWRATPRPGSVSLLFIRTGAVPSYTSMSLGGDTDRYQIEHLSRHQRYLVAVLAHRPGEVASSGWLSVTPRAGLSPRPEEATDLSGHLATVRRFTVMPQDRRLIAFWEISPGFVDGLVLELRCSGRMVRRLVLEPEVTSISLDAAREVELENGRDYSVRLRTRFAGRVQGETPLVRCCAAPQGEERRANSQHPQGNLIYPSLTLSPEVCIFPEEGQTTDTTVAESIVCCHCRQPVQWHDYRLRCGGCGAEFIPNGRGDFLDLGRLRFGTCTCCLPRKILIQRAGSAALACAHSGKEHIRLPGTEGYHLIEDLPFGLCQCCRPRRPLIRRGQSVRCSKSGEQHRNEDGRYVLLPSEPVFDASAIDALLDAGLAEICSTGVSRGSENQTRRAS